MRTLLAVALLLPLHAHAANYAGQWTLDRAQSKDLPPFYEDVQSHSMQIRQTDKQLILAIEITSASSDEPAHFDFTYTLDGVPVKTETDVRTPNGMVSVPTTLTAKPASNGDLEITIERELPTRGGEPMKGTTFEKWRLQEDGKTLVIDRVDEMRRGTTSSTLIFKRDVGSSDKAIRQ